MAQLYGPPVLVARLKGVLSAPHVVEGAAVVIVDGESLLAIHDDREVAVAIVEHDEITLAVPGVLAAAGQHEKCQADPESDQQRSAHAPDSTPTELPWQRSSWRLPWIRAVLPGRVVPAETGELTSAR